MKILALVILIWSALAWLFGWAWYRLCTYNRRISKTDLVVYRRGIR